MKGLPPVTATVVPDATAETQVALKVARGYDLQDIASDQAISLGTVRQYLKGVFAKTDTRRQAELAMLLVRLA